MKSPQSIEIRIPTTDALENKCKLTEIFCEGKFVSEAVSDTVICIDLNENNEWNDIDDIIMLVGAIETDVEYWQKFK